MNQIWEWLKSVESNGMFFLAQSEHWLLVAVPRLPLGMLQRPDEMAIAPHAWLDMALRLESLPASPIFDGWTGVPVDLVAGPTSVARLCTALPFVLLTTQG